MHPPDAVERVLRFSRGQRWAHRSVALLAGVCLGTAIALYVPDVSVRVGHRPLVSMVHVAAGLLLPLPLLIALLDRAFRDDARAVDRLTDADRRWLHSREARRARAGVGKFNAGQKLNSAFTVGWIGVMLMTGSVMRWGTSLPDDWRTGATFVHDWVALAIAVVVTGHVWMAANDPVARLGMRTGRVPTWWARAEHPAWRPAAAATGTGAGPGAGTDPSAAG